jgi:hypothetical protein
MSHRLQVFPAAITQSFVIAHCALDIQSGGGS